MFNLLPAAGVHHFHNYGILWCLAFILPSGAFVCYDFKCHVEWKVTTCFKELPVSKSTSWTPPPLQDFLTSPPSPASTLKFSLSPL